MAFMNASLSSSATLVARALEAIARLFDAAAVRHAQRRVYQETLNELSKLSTRELDDMGMHRSNLRSIAQDAARKHQHR
jgi:uncharacterized protein YjiS (DUF1127 family)